MRDRVNEFKSNINKCDDDEMQENLLSQSPNSNTKLELCNIDFSVVLFLLLLPFDESENFSPSSLDLITSQSPYLLLFTHEFLINKLSAFHFALSTQN